MLNYAVEAFLYGRQFLILLEKEMEPIQKEYGLNKVDMQILIFLHNAKERNTSKDIMELHMFTRGHISQSLSRLQKMGYVEMEQDREDRRCTHNYLTPKVDSVIEKLGEIHEKVRKIIFQDVTPEELEALGSIAVKVSHNIEAIVSDEG